MFEPMKNLMNKFNNSANIAERNHLRKMIKNKTKQNRIITSARRARRFVPTLPPLYEVEENLVIICHKNIELQARNLTLTNILESKRYRAVVDYPDLINTLISNNRQIIANNNVAILLTFSKAIVSDLRRENNRCKSNIRSLARSMSCYLDLQYHHVNVNLH